MRKQTKIISITVIILLGYSIFSFSNLSGYSQEAAPVIIDPAPAATPASKKGISFFKPSEFSKKQRKERLELREKQEKERKTERERIKAEKEKSKQENVKKLEKEKKAYGFRGKTNEQSLKQKNIARESIHQRNKQIRKTKRTKKYVEITSSEEDPLFIIDAYVKNTKSEYLKLKGVEVKYNLKLINQTPKIIKSVLIIWERKIPFTETLTIQKETKISRPIVPYERRIVEYNDLDSKREGETYRVKIASVVFEDGTQWKNPVLSK